MANADQRSTLQAQLDAAERRCTELEVMTSPTSVHSSRHTSCSITTPECTPLQAELDLPSDAAQSMVT